MTEAGTTTIGAARTFAASLLRAAGMPADPADRTAWALVMADAWGLGSHGLLRLPYYLQRFDQGGADPRAVLRLVSEAPGTAAYDGGNGIGHWQVWHAAETAVAKAEATGIAMVAVGNSGHCGSLGIYTLPMVQAGLVGLVFSNGPAVMPPWGGHTPVLSTSPIAAGIPLSPHPAIVDLATSAVARGKIAEHRAANRPLQPGWAFDAAGAATVDPEAALSGMLAPMGGAKGYAVAFLVEALTGGLVGPNLAGDVADPLSETSAATPQRLAHLVIALDPAGADSNGAGPQRLAALAERITAAGGRTPGANRRFGTDLPDDQPLAVATTTVAKLVQLGADRGVPTPEAWVHSGTDGA